MRILALVAIVAAALAGPASAVFPDRPPRIVSGYAAGGASDLISRFIADAVSPILGQRVVVENRPGVNGVIGAEIVARSAPDGYGGFTPFYEGPAAFARRLETDRRRWREVIQAGKVGAQ